MIDFYFIKLTFYSIVYGNQEKSWTAKKNLNTFQDPYFK